MTSWPALLCASVTDEIQIFIDGASFLFEEIQACNGANGHEDQHTRGCRQQHPLACEIGIVLQIPPDAGYESRRAGRDRRIRRVRPRGSIKDGRAESYCRVWFPDPSHPGNEVWPSLHKTCACGKPVRMLHEMPLTSDCITRHRATGQSFCLVETK